MQLSKLLRHKLKLMLKHRLVRKLKLFVCRLQLFNQHKLLLLTMSQRRFKHLNINNIKLQVKSSFHKWLVVFYHNKLFNQDRFQQV